MHKLLERQIKQHLPDRSTDIAGGALGYFISTVDKTYQDYDQQISQHDGALREALTKVRESQEKALHAEKLATIGGLASSIGHELRNPLGAIRNALYYIKDALKGSALLAEDPSLADFMDLIDREIRSANLILTDLLDFSRAPQLLMQPYDVNLIVLDCLRSTDIPTNISIFQNLADGLPRLPLDKDKIRQVLLNLIQNAVQAMTQGGELWLTSKFETGTGATGGRVSIAIRDTGEGISSEDLTKIFEPLFSTKAKGTGLGLPISKGLVERHGGTIEVYSIRGKGSTFTVKLPLREVAQNV